MNTKLFRRLVSLVLGIALLVAGGCSRSETAPSFTLPSLTGGQVSLADFAGRPVAITFWQLGCDSCIEKLPLLQAAFQGVRKDRIVTIVLSNSAADVGSFIESTGYTFPVLLDSYAAVAYDYGIKFTPTTVLVDSRGRIADTKVGPFSSLSELERVLQNLE